MFKNLFVAIIIVIPGLVFGFLGKPTEMGLAIVAGAIASCFLNIDKVQKFKGAGFEAEMREALVEAYATIDNLKELMVPLVWATMNTINHANRWGGINFVEKNEIKDRISEIVEKFQVNDERIKKSFETFMLYHTWDLFQIFRDSYIREKNRNDLNEAFDLITDRKTTNYPPKEAILKIIGVDELQLEDEHRNRLEDYLFFANTGKVRRAEINYGG